MAQRNDIASSNNRAKEADFKARRRLLKASAAVPLIGTLAPGVAMAASSSQCDLPQNTPTFSEVVHQDDEALRVEANYWKARPNNPNNDLFEVNDKFYDAISGAQVYPNQRSNGNPRGYSDQGQRYVLAYVETGRDPATGKLLGNSLELKGFYPQNNTGGVAMTDSCWSSIGGVQAMLQDHANG